MITPMPHPAPLLALALVAVPGATALAAPPAEPTETENETETETCEATPTLDEARLIAGRDVLARGEERFDEGDYLGAIEMWEQVMILLPAQRASVRVLLGHAHRSAYNTDADADHLQSAYTLFLDQLASLDADDEKTRQDLEAEIADIEAELAAIAEAEEQARAAREEEIRQEQILLSQIEIAEAEAEHQRDIQKIYYGVGGSLAGLGLGSLGAMAAFLARGAKLERQGRGVADTTDVSTSQYADLLLEGKAANRGAIITGIVGGVFTVAGTSLLIVAATRHQRLQTPAKERRVSLSPALGGMQLQF